MGGKIIPQLLSSSLSPKTWEQKRVRQHNPSFVPKTTWGEKNENDPAKQFVPKHIGAKKYPTPIPGTYQVQPVAPVVQVGNLEFYLFESWVRAPGG